MKTQDPSFESRGILEQTPRFLPPLLSLDDDSARREQETKQKNMLPFTLVASEIKDIASVFVCAV